MAAVLMSTCQASLAGQIYHPGPRMQGVANYLRCAGPSSIQVWACHGVPLFTTPKYVLCRWVRPAPADLHLCPGQPAKRQPGAGLPGSYGERLVHFPAHPSCCSRVLRRQGKTRASLGCSKERRGLHAFCLRQEFALSVHLASQQLTLQLGGSSNSRSTRGQDLLPQHACCTYLNSTYLNSTPEPERMTGAQHVVFCHVCR